MKTKPKSKISQQKISSTFGIDTDSAKILSEALHCGPDVVGSTTHSSARLADRSPKVGGHPSMNKSPTLTQLGQIMRSGAMPKDGTVFLGIDHRPPRRNGIEILSALLPNDADCRAVTGLSVILHYRGYATSYRTLKGLCEALHVARPKRLMLVDIDTKQIAFLVLGGKS